MLIDTLAVSTDTNLLAKTYFFFKNMTEFPAFIDAILQDNAHTIIANLLAQHGSLEQQDWNTVWEHGAGFLNILATENQGWRSAITTASRTILLPVLIVRVDAIKSLSGEEAGAHQEELEQLSSLLSLFQSE